MLVVDLVELVAGYGFEQVRDLDAVDPHRFRIMERVEGSRPATSCSVRTAPCRRRLIDATITAGPDMVYAAQSLLVCCERKIYHPAVFPAISKVSGSTVK